MGLFRSEEITHLKIRLPRHIEETVKLMDEFGRLEKDVIEFIDLNKDDIESKKNFEPMIKRCENMEQKIENFLKCAKEFNQKVYGYNDYKTFIRDLDKEQSERLGLQGMTMFDQFENQVIEDERRILELIEAYQKIKEDLIIEMEKLMVFQKFIDVTRNNNQEGATNFNILAAGGNKAILNIMGVINANDDIKMNRMVLRISRGRAMVTFFDFVYPEELVFNFTKDKKIQKKIFIIFFPIEGRDFLYKKLLQICDVLSASRYRLPEMNEDENPIETLKNQIMEKKNYLIQAEGSIKNFLRDVCGNENKLSILELIRLYFKKEKLIYTNLNKCILRENFIDGEIWVVDKYKHLITQILDKEGDDNKAKGTFLEIPFNQDIEKPTYIFTNEFLFPFQQIVNTYGIPRYKEINPTFFNIVTFPFSFGIMFGDIGHGLIVLFASIFLCAKEKQIKQSKGGLLKDVVKYRYFLLLLSLSSIYCGLLYNDFLSIPLPFFKSCYKHKDIDNPDTLVKEDNCTYPFGLDTKWFIAENELAFFNSFKMKFSVIFGIIHMTGGIILKGMNDIYFKDYVGFIFEFIPEIIFMGILFGYMVFMIFFKWSKDYSEDKSLAPSLISLMINIFIKGGSVDDTPLWGDYNESKGQYKQETFNLLIFVVCIVMIPFMMFPKPIFEYLKYKDKKRRELGREGDREVEIINQQERIIEEEENGHEEIINTRSKPMGKSEIKIKKEFNKSFVDFFIGQSIVVVEFVLGTVSNTASYLRLWALSLAHVELTKVFFEKTLQDYISEGELYYGMGFISIFIGYFIWANVTFFVLICMDFMECFLHTLRLHWVEFQNKFYKADGYLFSAYSFKDIIEIKED